ncbi:Golgi-specific brefeldin A-resistance guanine nucleotide exchange factor 1 isoform X1 [Cheilinus undulatus]|uniref:Golgi-specific brefeldin A-resistance guanine nucleotide exchange factor 1 isoform X1 n=2 Tax=Cheilinus undulatus TaxID=241271 RepID=UPI001BD4D56F|nr:Golgi-specific brefeldin A-resistance guanine nucleotide exchange factor 1 isoform X1 [Cheilinus undulatus]XP_041644665.1 Golgi-specific brefeldin A-resistance guanine nucleotide exchange factor 1 isoform X1 [Cheilinus undulatus]XP_041644666.1 Golgi-specific brefeldin A-resistance guanine nucleotide exchange factor 1 isoform X1 [Cheilinus undulatus]XP_041644667.1 Golgi-specific brefeldin A-resistance guanine nucleotide exchange factor 1 isoform X1 [Cheilinus undulatus]
MVDKNIYIVQGEIGTVVGAIKRNSRWNTHTPLDEEQDPLLNSFGHLKEILNNIKELSDVEPNVFLRPFLEVVRSEDTTGPITGLALTSVNKFLSYGLIDANHEAAAEAIENMADAVTHARFVGTDPASDEVVLMKILQVLRTLLLTPVGAHLTNESVCEIMQSCFRICFEMRLSELLRKSAEHTLVDMVQLLFSRLPQFKEEAKSYVGANMKKVTETSSCVLDTQDLICAEQHRNTSQSGLERLKMRAGGMSESSKWKKQKRSPRPPRHMVRSPSGQMDQTQPSTLSNNNISGGVPFIEPGLSNSSLPASDSAASSISSPTTTDSGLDTCSKATSREDLSDLENCSSSATTPSAPTMLSGAEPGSPDAQSEGRPSGPTQSTSVESIPEVLEDKDSITEQSDSASVHDMDYVNPRGVRFTQSTQRDGASLIPYGLPCLRELFRFLISLTSPHDRHNTDAMMHMGLQLLTVALESGHIANYQSLLGLVKDELCRHLFQLLSVERMNLYAASIRVCFLLFESMRVHLKFQLEMYLKKLMDIITSENIKMPYEMKEMALEAIVQLWRIPSFVTELYINYDCDFYCSNLFEDLTKLLSKNAFPVSGQLYTTHLLSLEALLTVIDSTEAHCQAKVVNNTAQQDQAETMLSEGEGSVKNGAENSSDLNKFGSTNGLPQAKTGPVCPPTSGHLMAEKMRLGRQDQGDAETTEKRAPKKPQRFSSYLPDSQELLDIRTKKKLLITGTEQFNQKPKKGIQFLQEKGLLSDPIDNNQVAQWLRENPRLDKKMIGEYISDRKNMELLDSFVNTFTFQGLRIDEALRLYLEAFRLPGEAPVIQRLLETFTDNWHKVNGSPFMTNDAGFALAYAVIMLNTDQHNHNVRKQNIPMTVEQFKKNLKGVNGNKDFDQDMLEDIYAAIKSEEIVMPDEQTGLVKENYVWSVLLHRGATSEGVFLHLPPGSYDHDLFTMTWGPTIAALSYVFDKSLDDNILQKAITGFRKCALIAAHYGFSDVFDNLIISLCKFTTLSSESVENLPTVFGSNNKAQTAAKTVFDLAHRHGNILREGWKNIMDSMLQLFRAELLPKAMVEVEDFVEPSGKISLQREETPSIRGESAVLSFVTWLTLSGAEQSGLRGPSTENQEAKQAAILCIKQCDPEKLITESKFLQLESLQELMKALISVTPDEETYDEEDAAFCLEMLLRIVLENRDRVSCVWQTVRDRLCHLCVHANESCFLVERAVVGLLRLAIRLLRREDISSQVLLSLRHLLMMKPHVLSRVSREVAYGLHELLKTNAANIHCTDDWYTLFSLLECIGAGVKPHASFQLASTTTDNDTGAQSDSELQSHHPSEASLDRGYTSDSEVYTEHSKARIPRSTTDVDVASSGWLVVGKDDLETSKIPTIGSKAQLNHPLVNQYSLTLGQDLGQHDTKSLIKCVETLSFIVRDAAHVTPDNFELCVRAIRVFVEASLNGGYRNHDKKKSHKYDSSKSRVRRKAGGREKEGGGSTRRGGSRASSQRPSRSHSDDEEDEGVPASYHTVSLQVSQDLLDLMHTLHTRAASIYSSWAEEQRHLEAAGRKIEADSQTLWTSCWCPLLQGIAWLCCDARRQVRMQALTYLQRALLVHDLQTLDATEWESCFNKVLFPLLTKLLDNISPADVGGMEETRMRACTLLSKVFLQHLSPLLSLPTFAALWLTILDFMDKYMHAGSSDLLLEAIPESLKNMLLVMDTAGIFHSADSRTGYSDLWEITWERIVCFLPHLREELFKQTVIPDPVPSPPAEPVQPTPPAGRPPSPQASPPPAHPPSPVPAPVAPAETKTPSRPGSPQEPQPASANGSDRSSPVPPSMSPIPVPLTTSHTQASSPLSQSPLILQPLASPLQVGVPPMSLPIILNPALIEATSPVPLLPGPRPTSPSDEVK